MKKLSSLFISAVIVISMISVKESAKVRVSKKEYSNLKKEGIEATENGSDNSQANTPETGNNPQTIVVDPPEVPDDSTPVIVNNPTLVSEDPDQTPTYNPASIPSNQDDPNINETTPTPDDPNSIVNTAPTPTPDEPSNIVNNGTVPITGDPSRIVTTPTSDDPANIASNGITSDPTINTTTSTPEDQTNITNITPNPQDPANIANNGTAPISGDPANNGITPTSADPTSIVTTPTPDDPTSIVNTTPTPTPQDPSNIVNNGTVPITGDPAIIATTPTSDDPANIAGNGITPDPTINVTTPGSDDPANIVVNQPPVYDPAANIVSPSFNFPIEGDFEINLNPEDPAAFFTAIDSLMENNTEGPIFYDPATELEPVMVFDDYIPPFNDEDIIYPEFQDSDDIELDALSLHPDTCYESYSDEDTFEKCVDDWCLKEKNKLTQVCKSRAYIKKNPECKGTGNYEKKGCPDYYPSECMEITTDEDGQSITKCETKYCKGIKKEAAKNSSLCQTIIFTIENLTKINICSEDIGAKDCLGELPKDDADDEALNKFCKDKKDRKVENTFCVEREVLGKAKKDDNCEGEKYFSKIECPGYWPKGCDMPKIDDTPKPKAKAKKANQKLTEKEKEKIAADKKKKQEERKKAQEEDKKITSCVLKWCKDEEKWKTNDACIDYRKIKKESDELEKMKKKIDDLSKTAKK